MGVVDLGRRIELQSMDPHFHDISIALYEQRLGDVHEYVVHSYSRVPGVAARLDSAVAAMCALGGMVPGSVPRSVRFVCGDAHRLATRRLFLDACKAAPDSAVVPRPMTVADKKSGQTIRTESLGGGRYRLSGDEGSDRRRVLAVARGLVRLAEMEAVEGTDDEVAFACGTAHDALIGLLMVRALNLRAVMREIEMQSARGVLAAPSAQNP